MRGKELENGIKRGDYRITPACAGKSPIARARGSKLRDHPRVCGEKYLQECRKQIEAGSPPRVRGKVNVGQARYELRRITPACAGKSGQQLRVLRLRRDHPRVCGEKISRPRCRTLPKGSPPRVRGKVTEAGEEMVRGRITPACAGKSFHRAFAGNGL